MGTARFWLRLALAFAGFFGGYAWSLWKWAEQAGLEPGPVFTSSLPGALLLGGACLALVAAWTPPARPGRRAARRGLSVTPAAFFGPFALGMVGIRAALWLVA